MSITYQEIVSQPSIWQKILERSDEGFPWCNKEFQRDKYSIYFIGCGTSYYLALVAASVYSRLTGACARAITSSDVMFFPESINCSGNVRAITISRSGETTETVCATQRLNKLRIPTLALTCQRDSSLSKYADYSYVIEEANELSVVMTRSFTGMLLVLQMLSAFHGNNVGYLNELKNLPELGTDLLNYSLKELYELVTRDDISMITFLGQGPFFGLASESMLKMKEMAITPTEVFHTLEFRHGPKSIVDKTSLVFVLLSDTAKDHEIKMGLELKEQGAMIGLLGEEIPEDTKNKVDAYMEIRSGLSEYSRIGLFMLITQQLAYKRAIEKGINPDTPINLSKVVTL